MFQYNPFALPPLFSALLIITIGSYVLVRNPQSEKHRSLFYFCLSCFIWLIFYTGIYLSTDKEQVVRLAKYAGFGVLFIPFTNLYFNLTLLQLKKTGFLICILIAILCFWVLMLYDQFYIGVYKYSWGYYPKVGPMHTPFLVMYISTWLYGLLLLHREMMGKKRRQDSSSYYQIRNVFLAWCGAFLGIVDFLPKYSVPIYPFAYIVALYWVFISALSLMQNKLSRRVQYVSRQFLIYSFFLVMIVLMQVFNYSVSNILSTHIEQFNKTNSLYFGALILGLIFIPLLNKLEKIVDSYFFYEFYSRESRYTKITQNILTSKALEDYNKFIIGSIYEHFKIIKISLYVWDDRLNICELRCTCDWGRYDEVNANIALDIYDDLLICLSTNRYIALDSFYNYKVNEGIKSRIISWMLKSGARLCIPIKREKYYGFLLFGEKESGMSYYKNEIDELLSITDMISIVAKTNHLVMSQNQMSSTLNFLQDISSRDSMTKLFNHSKSKELLNDIVSSCLGSSVPITVLIVDIDDFKKINDSRGHPVGDKVILSFSSLLLKAINNMQSTMSFAGRIGGEEFIVVLGGVDINDGELIARRLVTLVREDRVEVYGSEPVNYTVSIGISACPQYSNSVDDLILRADEMMYLAKQRGKNCVYSVAKHQIGMVQKYP